MFHYFISAFYKDEVKEFKCSSMYTLKEFKPKFDNLAFRMNIDFLSSHIMKTNKAKFLKSPKHQIFL